LNQHLFCLHIFLTKAEKSERIAKQHFQERDGEISFYGGDEQIQNTCSEHGAKKILVDCGLFQGLKELRMRNWKRRRLTRQIDASDYRTH